MANIKDWFEEEKTMKQVFEGVYPVIITAAKTFIKDQEQDDKSIKRRNVLELTFKTAQDVPFPDKTSGKITLTQQYYFDVNMHKNALNGVARACGLTQFEDTNDFEGKTLMIGITNRSWEGQDGVTKYMPQMGWGLFSYAKLCQGATIEYIANKYPNPTEEDYKEWFKTTLEKYKDVK